MILFDCDGSFLAEVTDGEELPEKIIRQIVVTTPQEERAVRLFLAGALEVGEGGSRLLARSFSGDVGLGCSVAAGIQTGATDGQSNLDDKLKIIEALTSALNFGGNIGDGGRELLLVKLRSVIDSL